MRECQTCKCCYPDEVKTCPEDGEATVHTLSGDPLLEGKYQLESRLGQGGMGVVYKARHTYLKTSHAIKVILPDLVGNDPQLITRFRQEALAAAAIRHQNVVNVSDYGVVEGKIPFLVMEFVQGQSLHDLLVREKRLSPEHAYELMSAICLGVGAAHRHGIVHRDLKPLNIIIQDDRPLAEGVKILDFGLAKIKSGELLGSFIQAQTTGLMGSPYYMAPEQWSDEDPDARSDIYSLGVMLFQMLAGDVPYKGSSIPAIMKKHLADAHPTFAELGITISPAVEAAVSHTLEKDRDKRTPTVEVLIEEFRNAVYPGGHPSYATTMPGSTVLPVSSLHVKTAPPQSKVFLNNTSVGQSQTDGSLMLEGIQSGNHHLRVSHDGFQDWEDNIVLDGKPKEVVARLSKPAANPSETMKVPQPTIPLHPVEDETMVSRRKKAIDISAPATDQFVEEKEGVSKVLLFGGIAAGAVALLIVFGIGIYWVFSSSGVPVSNTNRPGNRVQVSPGNTNVNSEPEVSFDKPDMIAIPGGKFMMGRNSGPQNEQPAHEQEVKGFWMDKTEVTNGEYYQFVKATEHPAPDHWVDGEPKPKTEKMPVRYVSYDDAKAFAAWRSTRDKVTYRLPTEIEWEYAARSGEKDYLYPWGNDWKKENAVMGTAASEPVDVGSIPDGGNFWGVLDLIGNVWEWTDTEIKLYPGSKFELKKLAEKGVFLRGGSAAEDPEKDKTTSTYRLGVPVTRKAKNIGFRLVRSQ